MGTTVRPAFTRLGAAITGFAAFVVFSPAIGATQHNWNTGLSAGVMIGLCVFVAHWFAAQPRRRC
ncbi:hypothetical protein [Actinoplanes sp. GCM10030250]|uniref:hypothetical protein n=1 Tax=Actinoplanes sp. GCM10030250 TaxID=3273376 RepID=UPI00361D567B